MSTNHQLSALDFFAGSGLVTEGLKGTFKVTFAIDICPKKCAVYRANFGDDHLVEGSIEKVSGDKLPLADLAWASFPCQDLSLAGNMGGLDKGTRSGLFWEWVRILGEIDPKSRPPVLCAENVIGFLVAENGKQFANAYSALRELGYRLGALVLDAAHFLPHSRPRSFIVAVREDWPVDQRLVSDSAEQHIHTQSVLTAASAVDDPDWVWWRLPAMPNSKKALLDIVERDAPVDTSENTAYLLSMLSPLNQRKLEAAAALKRYFAGTGYKRIRIEDGVRRQRLELRFDGVAGCLRTPEGGSSRQIMVILDRGRVFTRLLTVRETARLMGAPDSFRLPGSYNDGYRAMGDAVAVPVTGWLAHHLLEPLARPLRAARPWPKDKAFALHDPHPLAKAG
jgi:DNA (cytosine-5)-methyltransferase 1